MILVSFPLAFAYLIATCSVFVIFFERTHTIPWGGINKPHVCCRPPPSAVPNSYLSARGFLRNATSTEDYLSALKGLMEAVGTGPESLQGAQQESSMGMGVPVKWVKQQLPGSERVYQVRTSCKTDRVAGAERWAGIVV